MSRKYAFVPPRFGSGIGGGAETLVAQMSQQLSKRGDEVTILSTCARDNRTWENFYPPGESSEGGVRVLRFPVDPRDLDVWVPLQIRISEGLRLSIEEELAWLENSVNSCELYRFVSEEANEYDAVFFAPYLFGTTICGSLIKPARSFLIPCLHDESYAYLQTIASMFRQVGKALFNASPEMDLARSLYGEIRGGEVGMGFEPKYVTDEAPFFDEQFQYLLYIGRKETGKNVQTLLDYFIAAKERGVIPPALRLVIAGGGSFDDLHRPAAKERSDVVDIVQVSESEKERLIRHAVCLCQPSVNESFSIVIMEAWLLGTPVLVHSGCPVTRQHILEAGGGLYFRDEGDFAGCVRALLDDPGLSAALGAAGRAYVSTRYSWPAVLSRFDSVMGQFCS